MNPILIMHWEWSNKIFIIYPSTSIPTCFELILLSKLSSLGSNHKICVTMVRLTETTIYSNDSSLAVWMN